jgi:CRISPR-associated protein Csb1
MNNFSCLYSLPRVQRVSTRVGCIPMPSRRRLDAEELRRVVELERAEKALLAGRELRRLVEVPARAHVLHRPKPLHLPCNKMIQGGIFVTSRLEYRVLRDIVSSSAAALRCRTRLRPAGGPEDKVFPPSYEGRQYALEERRIDGTVEKVVLLDSVQSQANRIELALRDAYERGVLRFPLLAVDFAAEGLPHIGRITSLDAPHRIADAIFRECYLDGLPFRDSPLGLAFRSARVHYATPLLRYCPTALVFGVWDSTGAQGGLGAKFARVLTSEIIGVGAIPGVRTQSRVDPLPIARTIDIYQAQPGKGAPGGWTLDPGEALAPARTGAEPPKQRPSELNLGNVTPSIVRENGEPVTGGVTLRYALHTAVLSLPALRRLRFPLHWGERSDPQSDVAARTLLAALALSGLVALREQGYDLRSRCLLVPEEPLVFEVIPNDGSPIQHRFVLPVEDVPQLFRQAVNEVRKAGLPWPEDGQEEIALHPSPQLVELIRRSEAAFLSSGE